MFWVWAGAGGEFMRKPAIQWSREDVAEWVDGLGNWATNNYSQLFLGEVSMCVVTNLPKKAEREGERIGRGGEGERKNIGVGL